MNRGQRGSALPETALVLTLMLSLIVGALRIALVGYQQVAADGAAFYHAHQTGIAGTYPDNAQNLDPDDATHQAFGQSQTGHDRRARRTCRPRRTSAPSTAST